MAIEEFEELKQRFDFLSNQQADLIKAKESLHEAILKINRVTKKMFMETFEKLAVEFKKYFRVLFGGGDAQLFLLDEQDVLESGIEIVCRPPGKKAPECPASFRRREINVGNSPFIRHFQGKAVTVLRLRRNRRGPG